MTLIRKKRKPKRCPSCSGNDLGSYVPGLVIPTNELMEELKHDKIRLSGCVIGSDTPHWFCRTCDTNIFKLDSYES